MKGKVLMLGALAVLLISSLAVAVAPARAYGKNALWQVGLSFNCNNKDLCLNPPFGVGGFWGWIEFDPGGAGDATLTGCSHLSTSLGVLTGADHLQVEITAWTTAVTGSAGPLPVFVITDGTVSFTGVNTRGKPVTVPISAFGAFDTGVPALPGHYSIPSVFGFMPPPGINVQVQVVQVG